MNAAVANYTGDEVSIVDLTTRWADLDLGLDGDGTIKVFEGQTEVSASHIRGPEGEQSVHRGRPRRRGLQRMGVRYTVVCGPAWTRKLEAD